MSSTDYILPSNLEETPSPNQDDHFQLAHGAVVKVEEVDYGDCDLDNKNKTDNEKNQQQQYHSSNVRKDFKRPMIEDDCDDNEKPNPAKPQLLYKTEIKIETGTVTDRSEQFLVPVAKEDFGRGGAPSLSPFTLVSAFPTNFKPATATYEAADDDCNDTNDDDAQIGINSKDLEEQKPITSYGEVKVLPGPAISLGSSLTWRKKWSSNSSSSKTSAAVVETTTKLPTCRACHKSFRTTGQLAMHVCTKKTSAINKKKLSSFCEYCGLCFEHPQGLAYHLKLMEEQRHYLHSGAGKGFPKNSELPPKKYQCKFCKQRFFNLKRHIDNVHYRKRFQCHNCKDLFGDADELLGHLKKCKKIPK